MMKFRLLLIVLAVTFFLGVLATAVLAQEEVPPPYSGLENPFSWDDTSAQAAGLALYQNSCQLCHGISGGGNPELGMAPAVDFRAADFAESLEGSPDFYFWTVSEGRPDKGMPPYKSAFSDEQRWQVLTYLWSISAGVAPTEPAPPEEAPPLVVAEAPAPYTGLENPFSWDDASVQAAGSGVYQNSCQVCHGAGGDPKLGIVSGVNLKAGIFAQSLEGSPDFYFWTVSEGRPDKGMPAFKAIISEEEQWQVLTYLWSLGEEVIPPDGVPPTVTPPAAVTPQTLLLTAPLQAQAGQPLTLTATLQDDQDKPIANATVKFLIGVDFFASGLIEIGDATTNDAGVAELEYTPRQTGEMQVVARHQTIETTTTISLAESAEPLYQAEAGLQSDISMPEIFIGPESARELGEDSAALESAFRIPGSFTSLLLLVALAVIMVWATYFRVVYQVFRIPIVSEIGDTNTRLVPLAGLAIVLVMGILLVLLILTGPYTHLHLVR